MVYSVLTSHVMRRRFKDWLYVSLQKRGSLTNRSIFTNFMTSFGKSFLFSTEIWVVLIIWMHLNRLRFWFLRVLRLTFKSFLKKLMIFVFYEFQNFIWDIFPRITNLITIYFFRFHLLIYCLPKIAYLWDTKFQLLPSEEGISNIDYTLPCRKEGPSPPFVRFLLFYLKIVFLRTLNFKSFFTHCFQFYEFYNFIYEVVFSLTLKIYSFS